ncbi:SDR family NAD(P)-dependent oxidoreductase [bacterium]|nr:SDR family NAD(P)-dependent oxidoreductase [bacterium]
MRNVTEPTGSARRRTVLVTGASAGIGEATARRLLADGWTVYAGARRVERMRSLEVLGGHVLSLDVTDEDSARAAVERITAETGGVDALVNNAGYGEYGAVEEVAAEQARYQLEVNLLGAGRMIRLVLPGMRERRRGRIVNVTSMNGRIGFPIGGWYSASKFGLEGLSDSLRREVAPFGIDVVVVRPGSIRTEWAGITFEHCAETSAGGPYGPMAADVSRLTLTALEENGIAVGPHVVADTIARALGARRPRTRYAVPFHAKEFLFLEWLLPDRALDALFRLQMRWPAMARRAPWARRRG